MKANLTPFQRKLSLLTDVAKHFSIVFCLSAPMWVFSYFTISARPIFEYSTIFSIFILSYSRLIGITFLILFFTISFFNEQAGIYYFNFYDFLISTRYINKLNFYLLFNNIYFYIFAFSLIYILIISKYFLKKIRSKYSFIHLSFVLVIIIFVDVLNGSFFYIKGNDKITFPVNVIGTDKLSLALNSNFYNKEKKNIVHIQNTSNILNFKFVEWASNNQNRSIVFIIAESFGVVKSAKLNSWLREKLNIEKYNIIYNENPFKGSTTSGEIRSLCALQGSYLGINGGLSQNCLPTQLVNIGWSTSGLHGFSGRLFDRYLWWPKIGLQSTSFGASAAIEAMPSCGSIFRGACDENMVRLAFRQASRPKSFVYLLSLSTHLPVESTPIPSDLAKICTQDDLPIEVCMHIASLGRLLSNVANEASSLPNSPLIVVVGDHAPPFTNKTNRDWFRQDRVPSFILIPEKSYIFK